MYLKKIATGISLIMFLNLSISQDKSGISLFIYHNTKRIIPDAEQYAFSLNCNDTLYDLPVHSEFFDLGSGEKDQYSFISFPEIEIRSSDKVQLIFRSKKHTITSNLSDYFKEWTKTEPEIIFYYYYFSSFKKYEKFCENHNVYIEHFEPTQANFTKWQLFCFLSGHERWPYIPLEIISVVKNS